MGLNLVNFGKKLWDQINPFDNGRTWSNPQGNAPQQQAHGQAAPSVWHQVTHNGATNAVGNMVVKPLVVNPLSEVAESARTLAATATDNSQAQNASLARLHNDIHQSLPWAVGSDVFNTGKAITDLVPAVAAEVTSNPEAMTNATNAGLSALNKTTIGQLVSPVEAGATDVNPEMRAQAARDGFDVNATGAQKYFASPASAAANILGYKGAIEGAGQFARTGNPRAAFSQDARTADPVVKPASASPTVAAVVKGAQATGRGAKVAAKKIDQVTDNLTPFDKTNQAIAAAKDKYAVTPVKKAGNAIQKFIDPGYQLTKIDRLYAKAQGVRHVDLPASESLSALYDKSLTSGRQTNAMLHDKYTVSKDGSYSVDTNKKGEGTSIADLTQKYRGDSGKDFVNYMNYKFAKEVQQKRGINLTPEVTKAERDKGIADYEKSNPDAQSDAAIVKAHGDRLLDHAVEHQLIDKKTADYVKKAYDNFVPLDHATPEDLMRPTVGGNNLGSVSRQRALQEIKDGSSRSTPLDNTFDAILGRTSAVVKQANQNDLANLYRERQQAGHAPGEMDIAPGNKTARKAAREDIGTINKSTRYLSKKLMTNKRAAKTLAKEVRGLYTEGEKKLSADGTDPTSRLVAKLDKTDLSRSQVNKIVESLLNTRMSELDRITKKIGTREPKVAKYLDEVRKHKEMIDSNKELKQEKKAEIAQNQDATTTGKQEISGIYKGEPYKIEVPPEVADAMQGLSQEKLGPLAKALQVPTRIFQTAWTGFANPVFAGISFALYDAPMSIVNSKHGIKTLSASAVKEMFKSFNANSEFQRGLSREGAQTIGGSQLASDPKLTAESLAAERNLWQRVKFNVKHPSEGLERLDIIGGKLANATRTRIAKTHYDEAIKSGMNHEQALAEAVQAFNNVMPNYARVSKVAKQLNAVLPYTSASIAGTRSFGIAFKRDPVSTTIKSVAIGVGPVMGTTAYNMTSQEGQDFYKDMVASGKQYTLDNNIVIVMPGAHKDAKTGSWSGIIKIPVAPEMRAVNSTVWRATYDGVRGKAGDQANVAQVAKNVFDFGTGGLRQNSNPALDAGAALKGIDLGQAGASRGTNISDMSITNPNLANLSPEEQAKSNKNVSPTAKRIGIALGIPPANVDKVIGQLGFLGTEIQNRDNNYGSTAVDSVKRRFVGANGDSAAAEYYKSIDQAAKKDGVAGKDIDALHTIMDADIDPDGNKVPLDDKDALMKNSILANSPRVAAVVAEAARNRAQRDGKEVDPLYNLTPSQQQTYYKQQATPYKSDDYEYISDHNPWLKDFQQARSGYFDRNPVEGQTQNGKVPYPEFGSATNNNMNQYFNMDANNPQAKAQFLTDHPDVQQALDSIADYGNKKRVAQGYEGFDKYPKPDAQTQQIITAYNALPKNDGKNGGNATRSAWIRNNPGAYKKMTEYYAQTAQYTLANEAGKAKYDDESLNQKALGAVSSLARDIVTSTGKDGKKSYTIDPDAAQKASSYSSGGGSGYGSGSKSGASNPYTYPGFNKLSNPYRLQVKSPKTKMKTTKIKVSTKKAGRPKVGAAVVKKSPVSTRKKSKVSLRPANV